MSYPPYKTLGVLYCPQRGRARAFPLCCFAAFFHLTYAYAPGFARCGASLRLPLSHPPLEITIAISYCPQRGRARAFPLRVNAHARFHCLIPRKIIKDDFTAPRGGMGISALLLRSNLSFNLRQSRRASPVAYGGAKFSRQPALTGTTRNYSLTTIH